MNHTDPAREAARRANGRFGAQPQSAPEVRLHAAGQAPESASLALSRLISRSPDSDILREALAGQLARSGKGEDELKLEELVSRIPDSDILREALADVRARRVPQQTRAGDVQPGDVVDTEPGSTESPFHFAFFQNNAFRKALKAAGYPRELTVIGRQRADEDGHTDDAIVFDIGGAPFELTFHRDAQLRVIAAG